MLLPGPECVMGPRTDSSCCCQARKSVMGPCTASPCCCQVQSVSWVPVRPPIAAARPVICHGPLYRLLMLLPGPVCHGSLYGLPLLLSLSPHTLPCATFRS
ncbi:unnamed protein product, partial [Staurois parvus]